jgi:hypothetical protein
MSITEHPDEGSLPTTGPRARWSWGRRLVVAAVATLLVLAALLVAVPARISETPAGSSAATELTDTDDSAEGERPVTTAPIRPRWSDDTIEDDSPIAPPVGRRAHSLASEPTPPTSGSPTPAAPRLVVPSELFAEPGTTDAQFTIGNGGGSMLSWSIDQGDSPVPFVSPGSGSVAPGAQVLVAFELPLKVPSSDGVYPFTIESNGGSVDVAVHIKALDPVLEIVDGTWSVRNGNSFGVSAGHTDLGLKVKNVGTEPLWVKPQPVSGLVVVGGPWVLEPGQQVHLQVVLCNASYSGGNPDLHVRDLHIQTDGWQGTIDFKLNFKLLPGQAAPAC